MSKINVLMITALLLFNIAWIGAQDSEPGQTPFTPQQSTNQRAMGDQAFAISAGLFLPLPTYLFSDIGAKSKGFNDSQLSIGGMGSLTYSFYLSGNFKVGLQVAGSFTREINYNYLYIIPIIAKATWEFHPWNRISIPIHLGLGVAMSSYKDFFVVDAIIKPGFGVYFDWNFEWSFGLDMSYWFIPQIGASTKEAWAIGQFLDISLTAEYHF